MRTLAVLGKAFVVMLLCSMTLSALGVQDEWAGMSAVVAAFITVWLAMRRKP
jgi:hypothetical protein